MADSASPIKEFHKGLGFRSDHGDFYEAILISFSASPSPGDISAESRQEIDMTRRDKRSAKQNG